MMSIGNDWDLKQYLLAEIKQHGGWANVHTHLDRAYTINPSRLEQGNAHLHQKWSLVDEIKRNSTVDDIYDRMSFALEKQRQQGVTTLLSFIDIDPVIKDKAMLAADRVRAKNKDIELWFANQSLKGVLTKQAAYWFKLGSEFVDVIGGLPAKDFGKEEEHLDMIFNTAQKLNKIVHVHADQLNTPQEKETELLLNKVEEHAMQGRVFVIHGVSLASHPKEYREQIYQRLFDQKVGVITCPTAWIDARRSEEFVPSHNAIAPIEELVCAGVTVALGTDNIADIYKPFTDGEMWTELRFLLESCHFYDLEQLVKIATDNGRKVLGLIN